MGDEKKSDGKPVETAISDELASFEADVVAVRNILKKYASLSPQARRYLAETLEQRVSLDPELKALVGEVSAHHVLPEFKGPAPTKTKAAS